MPYDAFLSYSHAADGRLAPALQAALHRFARSWFRRRALHVFRDTTTLAATPALWSAIERALGQSRYFILLASPESARSPWVVRELEFWCRHRRLERLLVVVTAGRLAWDAAANDFDWDRTDALPGTLRGSFEEEPLYLDLTWARHRTHVSRSDPRFRDAVATLAATLHGMPKDEIIGEDVRRHRNAKRLAWSAVGALALLLAATSITAWIAVQQREEAVRQRELAEDRQRLAESRQLQAQADAVLRRAPALLERSMLLALESLRKGPSFEANQTLRQGLDLLPRRLAAASHNNYVTAVDFSPDGRWIATASSDGYAALWKIPGLELTAAMPHGKGVDTLAFSPDGGFLATAGRDRLARLWRLPAGEAVLQLEHGGTVNAVAYSSSGRYLATGSDDKSARVWDAANGDELLRVEHGGPVNHVAFSPDEARLASASGSVAARMSANLAGGKVTVDDSARVWDIQSGKEISRLGHDHGVARVVFAPGGDTVATASLDGTARLWETATGREIVRLQHEDSVTWVAFAPGGRHLLTASGHFLLSTGDHWARVWEIPGGRELYRLRHQNSIDQVVASPDGRLIGTASDDNSARLWEAATGGEIARVGHENGVTAIAFSPDGASFATADAGGAVRLWQTPGAQRLLRSRTTGSDGLAVSPDGRRAAASITGGGLLLLDVGDGKELARLAWDTEVFFLHWGPDGRRLAGTCADGTVRVWDADAMDEQARLAPGSKWTGLRLGPAGLLAAASDDRMVRIWHLPDDQNTQVLPHAELVRSLAFNANGSRLATASDNKRVRIWRLADGALERELTLKGSVQALTYSADGSLLAAAAENEVRIWRGAGMEELTRIQRADWAWDLAFSRDGAYLATAGALRTATVWEVASGRRITAIPHERSVQRVAFVGDGSVLASTSGDILVPGSDRVLLSPWHPDDLAAGACNRLTRNLTQAEWRDHLPGEAYRLTCRSIPADIADALERPRALAQEGETDQARVAFAELVGWATETADPELNNAACWFGSLHGQAAAVMPACERAVEIAPDTGSYRDSRGLARALIGDRGGAGQDFRSAATWMREQGAPEMAEQREAWLRALREGGDPFDEATRKSLLEE